LTKDNKDILEPPLRVILIDDHSLFRAGLEELLARKDIKVVASVGDGNEGIKQVEALKPDIVLLDIRMPKPNGLEVLKILKAKNPDTAVIMVTTSREDADVAEAMKLGAQGYLLKDMEPDELITSLNSIRNGEIVVAPTLAGVLARVVQGKDDPSGTDDILSTLTPREKEIIYHLAKGGSNKAIARVLNISDGTVKLHVKSILRKLNIHSRVEAAVIAVEYGLENIS